MEIVIDSKDVSSLPQIECVNCVKTLPLRISRDLEQSSVWICVGCGVSFVGVAHPELLEHQGRLVRLHDQYFDNSQAHDIPVHIRRHIASQASRSSLPAHLEKRRSERVYNSMVIQGVELDRDFRLQGQGMKIILTDISREGVGLAIPHAITHDFLALKIPVNSGSAIQTIARVRRQRELSAPFFEIGCEFITRLGN
ncbi:MAG: PilZ domain-containing protein [Bythopirellula sp.]|nr:PilZ domain-containing protein [Bythopirellula sp.]